MENHHHHEDHDHLRRSQNGTQWGSDRNPNHDSEERLREREDQGLLADDDAGDAQDWGNVDPQSGSYDPDTDPSGPGSAV